jgi:hypothetical protein
MRAEDAQQRTAAQAGMADRLRPAATRVLDTTGALPASRAMVVEALAQAIAGAR